MTGLLVQALLAIGGGAAALLLNRDAPGFPIVQSMLALVVVVLTLVAVAVLQPASAAWLFQHRASPHGAAGAAPERRRSRPWAL